MDNNRFKSKMLTDDFICPERFFKSSLKMTNQSIYLNAALNYRFTDNDYNNVVKYYLLKYFICIVNISYKSQINK